MSSAVEALAFTLNGQASVVHADPGARLADVLRDRLGLTGTKIGCNAGDCGACTVLLDGAQVCACLVAMGQVAGRRVTTIEGIDPQGALPQAFLRHGAAQCGICTPGMLMAATDLLARIGAPSEAQVQDALGGVLCRCTGYRKIIEAVLDAAGSAAPAGLAAAPAEPAPARAPGSTPVGAPAGDPASAPAGGPAGGPAGDAVSTPAGDPASALAGGPAGAPAGDAVSVPAGHPASAEVPAAAVGARLARVDGPEKVSGREKFGADALPEESFLTLRAIRSPYPHARFVIGDLAPLRAAHPGLACVLTAADIPGRNLYGIYPTGKDQPVLAWSVARHRGDPVCALVGDAETLAGIADSEVPIAWQELPPVGFDTARTAPALHAHAPGNVLCEGRVATGDPAAALSAGAATAAIAVETSFVEHAYIEPEAGYARRVGERIEVFACTQTPYMDRDELAPILGIAPEAVRVVPSAVGGGFGGKLDLSVQPLACVAAWLLRRPVRMVYSRPESMQATTKRHPARIRAEAACDAAGRLTAFRFHGDFNTGAYASWGPTVANRVPVHAMGPYEVPNVLCTTAALHTNDPPAGAFRGFGVPQAAVAGEALMDLLADRLGQDRLDFRLANALRAGSVTATGQRLGAGAALPDCLLALRPHWRSLREAAAAANRGGGPLRHGVGIACMWYGIGNTSLANPSEMRLGIDRAGRAVLFSGAVDIGQGSNTIMVQIAADALGVPAAEVHLVAGDTDRTPDAGKTSASRQTFVSGNAARLAGVALRGEILRRANAGAAARIALQPGRIAVTHDGVTSVIELADMPADAEGIVLEGRGRFDPPTTPLDADGQGTPYAAYAFAAQIAVVEVDTGLGTVAVRRIVAAHDVGRAINPTLVEGQIHGGIAQGLGLALMEEYVPGRTENLHDYLIPTIGDIPPITTILIEQADPLGPYGAKGVGEPALVATAPAILGAIADATGRRPTRLPVTPDRLLALLRTGAAS
jgi:CO/xanthine dehydrogenase Mo-binding subunit/aerobic-type carbon monoxide dehydrogenase small subunit (CoxS/CutS family)